jgi:ArsR family transcriptional regulator
MRIESAAGDTRELETAWRSFQAFADPVRLRILNLLSEDREVCVCHLHEALGLPQPTVSRHLASLRKQGLVIGRKEGLWVHYRLARPKTALQRTLLDSVGKCLSDLEVLQCDRLRLAQVATRCTEP